MERTATLNHLFLEYVASGDQPRLLAWQSPSGESVYSSARFADAVFALRNFFRALELGERGERIAIFSPNRPEWHAADFAIHLARHIVVPIYATLAPAQIEYLLENSGCRAIVIGGAREWDLLRPLLPRLPELRAVIHMDGGAVPTETPERHLYFDEILSEHSVPVTAAIRGECLAAEPSDVATIVYTSGTTATPKGVMLTHGNLIFDLEESLHRLDFRGARQALSVLPLAHVFERLLCYGYFRIGVPIAYGDPHDLRDLLPRYQPEVMGCVPRILEKMREAIEKQVENATPLQRHLGRRLFRERPEGSRPNFLDRIVQRRVQAQLGGVQYFVCGGAWLDPSVQRFFENAGFTVLQGYGMTETSPVIALSEIGNVKLGSVGRPLGHVEVRISPGGEIETRGEHVMRGYYQDPAASAATLRDGWLATGDLGRIDEDGFLYITGRIKDMLVLSNGKKVSSASLEKALARSRLIQDAFVVGDGRNYTSAVIVPRAASVLRMAREQKLPCSGPADWASPPIAALFRSEIEKNQAEFSNFERVKRFCFLAEEALLDPELVTPTQKLRRKVLETKYRAAIDRMYQEPEPFLIPTVSG